MTAPDSRAEQAPIDDRPPADRPRRISLALAGGNALGAYTAGAYEALHEAGIRPDIIAGASIGSVTGAIIAGNPPERVMERLQSFWEQAAAGSAFGIAPAEGRLRNVYNKMHVAQTVLAGRPGLFVPRPTGFASLLPGTPSDIGLFDGGPLIGTLQRLIDFDHLNAAHLPLVIAAVDVETGEPVYFDNRVQPIAPEHLLATTAFMPAFPPVEVDGRLLGDPGMYCNLPLDPLLASPPPGEQLCFVVDLFDARGPRPSSLDSALERAQDIAFASQSLRTIDTSVRELGLRTLLGQAREQLVRSGQPVPPDLDDAARDGETEIVLIAYRPPQHETGAKTLEYSRVSIAERWARGRADMSAALASLRAGHATRREPGCSLYDCRSA